jgi:hypothetical protein
MKPAYHYLRSKCLLSVAYIDDCYLQGMTCEDCRNTVEVTHILFSDLGFLVHPDKSVFIPQHEIVFLGFLLNSLTISLTPEKINKFLEFEKQFKLAKKYTIRQVAKLVGMLIAYSVAIPLGMLYTRVIERNKANAWNFDSYMIQLLRILIGGN